MTTSYNRDQLAELERAMLDGAPALPEVDDLLRAYYVPGVVMAGSDAGVLMNIGVTHKRKPVFMFLNCVVAKELFHAIYGAADEVWPKEQFAVQRDDTLAAPALNDMNTAVDIMSLTTTAAPDGLLVNMSAAGDTFALYLSRAVAMEILEGIQIAGQRAAWWDEDFELLPTDGEQQQVSDRDVWAAANQLIRMCPDDPGLEAARRSDAALADGDVFNARLWSRVLTAVQELRRQKPSGETVN